MKKLLLSLALMAQVGLTMAHDKANTTMVQVRNDNVKMFKQAGTSTPIVETIATTDRVELVRKFNKNWAIVLVNNKVGYVLLSELTNLKATPASRTLAKQ
ncbi:SH3 domain-containing protein [Adhaeribacter pallidiroseus]|uniref:SH3b domain-containing protein n=1 Tax=Adhaeribacter pallidiroseus TaxID=2072847 RepID=A0A369QN36_9BACT|nr:SH3 domain-containing protein [Adhaeribacter pallidiroseus]RDC66164.1 hypothetical protein AHMF7616_04795 [Adhaeribacter pallidiroseus]